MTAIGCPKAAKHARCILRRQENRREEGGGMRGGETCLRREEKGREEGVWTREERHV
jgi:hypothetical protein